MKKITPRMVARSFVACKAMEVDDYSSVERRDFGLRELEHSSLVREFKDVIEDAELAAQLEDWSDDEEVSPSRSRSPMVIAVALWP